MNTQTPIANYTRIFSDGCQLIVTLFSQGMLVIDEAIADTPFEPAVVDCSWQFDTHERDTYRSRLRALLAEYEADTDYGLWHATTFEHGISNQFTDAQMIDRF